MPAHPLTRMFGALAIALLTACGGGGGNTFGVYDTPKSDTGYTLAVR